MRLQLSLADIKSLKGDLFNVAPQAPLTRRIEAAARALGFRTYNGLRTALSTGPQDVEPNDQVFAEFLGLPHSEREPVRVVSRTVARVSVRKTLEAIPQLTQRGFDSISPITPDEKKMTVPERKAALLQRRLDALDDHAMDEFELAWIYLSQQEQRKTINHDFGSYQLKHRAEDLSRKLNMFTHLGDYVSNGMLIAAAHVHGFKILRAGYANLNARFNISSKSIRATAAHPVITLQQQQKIYAMIQDDESV